MKSSNKPSLREPSESNPRPTRIGPQKANEPTDQGSPYERFLALLRADGFDDIQALLLPPTDPPSVPKHLASSRSEMQAAADPRPAIKRAKLEASRFPSRGQLRKVYSLPSEKQTSSKSTVGAVCGQLPPAIPVVDRVPTETTVSRPRSLLPLPVSNELPHGNSRLPDVPPPQYRVFHTLIFPDRGGISAPSLSRTSFSSSELRKASIEQPNRPNSVKIGDIEPPGNFSPETTQFPPSTLPEPIPVQDAAVGADARGLSSHVVSPATTLDENSRIVNDDRALPATTFDAERSEDCSRQDQNLSEPLSDPSDHNCVMPSAFNIDQKTTERIVEVLKDVERLGGAPLDGKSAAPKSLNVKRRLDGDMDSVVIDPIADEECLIGCAPDNSTELQRNETLDKKLQLEMIEKVQAPSYASMNSKRKNLPTFAKKQEILKLVDENQVVVVSGETGCGKTTQLPQYLLEHAVLRGRGSTTRVVVTQPRRISAISVAERVAAERGQRLGEDVGYQIRLEAVAPRRSQGSILFCTTGIVLQWFHSDPLLKSVSHVVVDEVHEREMLGDFLLAMLKRILPQRPDLRVILMSATLNSVKFSQFFDGCPKLEIPGRTFPVDALFLEDVLHLTKFNMPPDVLYRFNKTNQRMAQMRAQSVASPPITPDIRQNFKHWLKRATPRLSPGSLQFLEALDIHGCPPPEFVAVVIDYIIQTTDSGAILAFVPGLGDILDTMKTLRNMNPAVYGQASGRVVLHGLHSRLPTARQRTVFDPPPFGKRKVVIATNIAETSITIEDIVYVVDCGQIKITTYDPQMNTSTLAPVLVSKANAAQRRGRAGRVRPGRCFHLFSSFTYERVMLDYLPPEIMRIRLEDIILRIKALDLGPVTSFLANCMDPPALEAVRSTLKFLRDIQALKPPNPSGPDSPTGSTSVPVARLSTMKKKQRDRLVAGAIEAGKTSVAGARNQSEEDYDNDVLTPLGHHLANLPMDPQCAKLLILGTLFCCLKPALAVAACLAFKEPFEVPIGSEAAADRRRAELTEGSQSDHWGFYVALSEYMDLREHEKYNFCKKNFLNRNTMDDLCRLMHEFVGLLYERRYITSMDMNESAVNRHSHDVRIFRAALAGAFYPNLILASARKRKPNGVLPAPIIKGPSSDEKVALHSKSVNANLRPLDHLWFVYFQKMKLDHGAASTIFDSTLLSARPVVFFSSKLTQTTVGSEGLLVVDGWIKFKAGPRVPRLIEGLKLCLDRLLDSKIRNLGSTNWDPSSIEGRIIQTIVDYFINEAPPAFEIADHSRAPVWKQHQQQQQGGGNVQTHHGAQTMNKPKR